MSRISEKYRLYTHVYTALCNTFIIFHLLSLPIDKVASSPLRFVHPNSEITTPLEAFTVVSEAQRHKFAPRCLTSESDARRFGQNKNTWASLCHIHFGSHKKLKGCPTTNDHHPLLVKRIQPPPIPHLFCLFGSPTLTRCASRVRLRVRPESDVGVKGRSVRVRI